MINSTSKWQLTEDALPCWVDGQLFVWVDGYENVSDVSVDLVVQVTTPQRLNDRRLSQHFQSSQIILVFHVKNTVFAFVLSCLLNLRLYKKGRY